MKQELKIETKIPNSLIDSCFFMELYKDSSNITEFKLKIMDQKEIPIDESIVEFLKQDEEVIEKKKCVLME